MSNSTLDVLELPSPVDISLPIQQSCTLEILELLPPGTHLQLGYFGGAPRVFFYFDVRADDVVWNDGHRYGIGTGAWQTFAKVIEPLARKYRAKLSGTGTAPQALVVDRATHSAYFMEMNEARRMVRAENRRKSIDCTL